MSGDEDGKTPPPAPATPVGRDAAALQPQPGDRATQADPELWPTPARTGQGTPNNPATGQAAQAAASHPSVVTPGGRPPPEQGPDAGKDYGPRPPPQPGTAGRTVITATPRTADRTIVIAPPAQHDGHHIATQPPPGERTVLTTPPEPGGRPAVTALPAQDRHHIAPPPPPGERTVVTTPPEPGDRPAVTALPAQDRHHIATQPPPGERTVLTTPPEPGDRPAVIALPAQDHHHLATQPPPGERTVLTVPPEPGDRTVITAPPASDGRTLVTAPPYPRAPTPAGMPMGMPTDARTGSLHPTAHEATMLAMPPIALATGHAPDLPPQPGLAQYDIEGRPATARRDQGAVRQLLPPRTRRYGFSLTAFADAMFQLLIFFMLASNLAPFSLLTLRHGAGPGASGSNDANAATPAAPGQTAIWTLSRDGVTAGGQRFDFAQLGPLAEGMKAAGTEQVLLVTRGDADVQGIVRVLEALARNGIGNVQLAAATQPQPQPSGAAP